MNLALSILLADVTPVTNAVNTSLFNIWTGVIGLLWYLLIALAMWLVFAKAGWPGILALIPIVNIVILVKIAGYSGWMALLYLIPIVNIVFSIIVAIKVGATFGKGGAWSFFLLWLIAFVGYLMLGLGDAKYTKPVKA
ncbi:DUF5684 domain-containing protein [Microbacterium sp. cf046]|uniref:DUF5684 domain-containing protein n=1 Tax=Microbacterium sp. cf046 TaxID=1761803 RepID=UPI000B82505C|nr:DUF5684 domain-containing protein [Microbacterium sp. cf046]